ncbi:ATP synthase subunit I [Cohnella panacarvi]|uniref:ATP synthase subunit I n=1 Tax=Cohnella panacarvi TaxID=400776 RepID=UPI00047CDA5A|nr:ATP synthase subunit I [Cohnella panacarvi]
MMDELPKLLQGVTRFTLFFLSLGCVAWAVWPNEKAVFGGFMVGAIASVFGSWHLAWKTIRLGDVILSGRKPRAGFGFIFRTSLALLAVIVSDRYLEFSPAATVVGLFTAPLATLLLSLLANRRVRGGNSGYERGEK